MLMISEGKAAIVVQGAMEGTRGPPGPTPNPLSRPLPSLIRLFPLTIAPVHASPLRGGREGLLSSPLPLLAPPPSSSGSNIFWGTGGTRAVGDSPVPTPLATLAAIGRERPCEERLKASSEKPLLWLRCPAPTVAYRLLWILPALDDASVERPPLASVERRPPRKVPPSRTPPTLLVGGSLVASNSSLIPA